MPLVSIIIPAYNSSAYIGQTLKSVLEQTYRPIEIIVVDDGSTDGTIAEASHYKKHGVTILSNPKKGACAARNFGYMHSKGEFIQFLDSDDPIAPNKIESQLNQLLFFSNYQRKLVHCRWGRFIVDIDEVYYWGPDVSVRKNLKPIDWLVANHMSMTGCWLTPRQVIEKGGLWDETLKRNQDGEFFSRLMTHADEVLYCDAAKVYYRSGNTGSISNVKSRPAMESLLKSLQHIEKYMLQLEASPRVNLSIANRYQDFVYANFIANPDLAAFAENKIKELGGSELKLPGGAVLRCLATLLGWKNALKIKRIINRST
jgi:glycosyltransferase involved in cell wall biosynthesis